MTHTELRNQSARSSQSRLAIIRRIYLYLIAFVSLVTGLIAADGLIAVLLETWLASADSVNAASFVRNTVARNGGLLLVAAPIFLIHWAYIRSLTRDTTPEGQTERRSAWRKLFLYAAMAAVLILGTTRLYDLIRDGFALMLNAPTEPGSSGLRGFWPVGWLQNLLTVGMSVAFLAYFSDQIVRDADLGEEINWAGTIRRLFQTIVGLVGLALLIFGAANGLETILRQVLEQIVGPYESVVGDSVWRSNVADAIATLLVGSLLWRINWLRWDELVSAHDPEARTALRRTYLYAATVLSASAALVPAAGLLNDLLRRLFGVATTSELPDLAQPLSLLSVGIVAWQWHWQQVRGEADRYGDTPESATVRRLYYYLVAAVGLVLLWIGLVEIVQALLDWLLIGSEQVARGFRSEQIANGLSLLAVGAPVWAVHWRTVQQVARREDEAARNERNSGPRRAYLYGVALVGALLILFDLATVLYRLLLWLLGDPVSGIGSTETLNTFVRSGTASVFWVVHLLAIRGDTSYDDDVADADMVDTEITATREAYPAGARDRGEELQSRIQRLERELEEARAELQRIEENRR